MDNVKSLRKALQQHKVRLSEQQLAELDRRQWLEDMRAALNAEQNESFSAALKALEAGLQAMVDESVQKAVAAHSEAVAAQVKALEGTLDEKLDGLSFEANIPDFPEVDLSRVIEEIRGLPKVKQQRVWSFDVERDRRGNIVRIHADGTAGES